MSISCDVNVTECHFSECLADVALKSMHMPVLLGAVFEVILEASVVGFGYSRDKQMSSASAHFGSGFSGLPA